MDHVQSTDDAAFVTALVARRDQTDPMTVVRGAQQALRDGGIADDD